MDWKGRSRESWDERMDGKGGVVRSKHLLDAYFFTV